MIFALLKCKCAYVDTIYHPAHNLSMVRHGGSSIMLQGCFFLVETVKLLRVKGKMDIAKQRKILEEYLFEAANTWALISYLPSKDHSVKHEASA